ncbi:MAG: NAD-dependent epimerase/dehydratase family protein [Planctomycetota bacterium]|jgi:nucleoside-diphosphate-sugar epimerase
MNDPAPNIWPQQIETVAQLEDVLTTPSEPLIKSLAEIQGDLVILGVGGKMGPTLARLARRALDAAGSKAKVIGVDQFTYPDLQQRLEKVGIQTIAADLLQPDALPSLPEAKNVIYMVGYKFGSMDNQAMTWAVNTYLPARVAERYANSRIVALSTGNVYPLVAVSQGGPAEDHPVGPIGEYAQSCLGRERMFQYFSQKYNTPVLLFRLNYAIDLRYGVLLDTARKVHTGKPIDLTMGYVNVIWQGDANSAILQSLAWCDTPPAILNVTGPQILSVRSLAEAFAQRLGREPVFQGKEDPTALLNDASRYAKLAGPPAVSIEKMIDWIAHWVSIGGPTLDKPTHFEVGNGKF